MITLRRHTAEDYANLPNIDDPDVSVLSNDDRKCLDEIGGRLIERGAHHRFGVTLLHNHFAIADDETMVEQLDRVNKRLTLRPVRDVASDRPATSICFETGYGRGRELKIVGLEFSHNGAEAGYESIGESDTETLIAVRDVLTSNNKLRRFGLRLLHDPLELDDQIRFERCDENDRVLICEGIQPDDPDLALSVSTVFRWKDQDANRGAECTAQQKCVPWHQCHAPTGTHQRVSGHRKE
jgi:hypothetical protein